MSSARYLFGSIVTALWCLLLTSCVHEWPDSSLPIKVNLNMSAENGDSSVKSILDGSEYDLRYIVAAHRRMQDGSYSKEESERFVFSKDDISDINHNISLMLVPGVYKLYFWVDYVRQGSTENLYYDPSNFRQVEMLTDLHNYEGNNEYKNVHTTSQEIELEHRPSSAGEYCFDVALLSPMARYEIIATDVKAFITKQIEAMMAKTKGPVEINLSDYKVKVYYEENLPNTFNIHTNQANDVFEGRVSFESNLTRVDDESVMLCFDYIYINHTTSDIFISIEITDKEGEVVASSKSVELDVARGESNTISDNFLTSEAKEGIGVDPGFGGPDIDFPVE